MLLSSHEKEQKLRPLLQRLPEAKEASSNTYITEDKRTDLFQRTCYTTLSKYSTCVSLLSQVGARIPSGQFSSISLNSIWWFPGLRVSQTRNSLLPYLDKFRVCSHRCYVERKSHSCQMV